jgi:site-specific recombinase XerD
LRSFLRHNGYNSLPKANLQYTPTEWHRGYKKHEIRKLLGYLPKKLHKLFVSLATETGLRVQTVLELRYRHIMEDIEAGIVPVAIRLEPRFYAGRKTAGFTFLGDRSVELLRECLKDGLIRAEPEARLIPRNYHTIYWALYRAKKTAGLDPVIQPCHGLRKYFENALDEAGVDHERKMMIEGHFAGTRAKHYTDRDSEQLREIYKRAYPYIDLEGHDSLRDLASGTQLVRYRTLEAN